MAPLPAPPADAPGPSRRWSLSFPPSNGALFSSFGVEPLNTPGSFPSRRGSAPAMVGSTHHRRVSVDARDEGDAERRAWLDGRKSRSMSVAGHFSELAFDDEDLSGWKGLRLGAKGARRRSMPTLSVSHVNTITISPPILLPTPPEPATRLYFPAPRVARPARVGSGPHFHHAPLDLELGPRLPTFYDFLAEIDPELQPLSHWLPQPAQLTLSPEPLTAAVMGPPSPQPPASASERRRPAPLELPAMPVVIPRLRRNDTIQEESERELELDASGISSGSSSPTPTLLFSPHPSPSMSECEAEAGASSDLAGALAPAPAPYWSPTENAIEWSIAAEPTKGLKPLRLPAMVSLATSRAAAACADADQFPILAAHVPKPLPPLTGPIPPPKKQRRAIVIAGSATTPPASPVLNVRSEAPMKVELRFLEQEAGQPHRRMSLHEQFWDALEEIPLGMEKGETCILVA